MKTTGFVRTRDGLVRDLCFAFGITAVPVLVHHPPWILLTTVLVAAVGTRSAGRAAVLAAYALPAVVGAPWPVHCVTAWATWALLVRRRRPFGDPQDGPGTETQPNRVPDPAPNPATDRVPNPARVAALLVLGAAAGVVVVFLDHTRIVDHGFAFAVARPSPLVLGAIVVALAVGNAMAEELLWREALDRTLTATSTRERYAFQVVTFGLGHWSGIPHGVVGVVASGLFSAILYRVRERTGLLGAVVVHAATDLVIFGAVAWFAQFVWTGFTWTTT